MQNTPRIGQIIDFYASNAKRFAAMVAETIESEQERPNCHLYIYTPTGDVLFEQDVPPAEEGDDLTGKWGFHHEFSVDTPAHSNLGSESNDFVGETADI